MSEEKNLSSTEELDFQYLLELMMPLYDVPEFSWLPELFSIIGYDKLVTLCKYAGGECIVIPTLDQLSDSIEALQYYYDVEIKHTKDVTDVPIRILSLFMKIRKAYDSKQS